MKELTNPSLLKKYLQQYKIQTLFDTPNLPFRLYEYEAGELLDSAHPAEEYLKILIEGEIRVYAVNKDGSMYSLFQGNQFGLLSNWEFCGYDGAPYWTEAINAVRCLELPLANYRSILLNDNRFLRYLLQCVVQKHADYTSREISLSTTVEKRLLYYLQYEAEQQVFSGVEALAFRLHCSRSQIQRALRELLQTKQIVKIGKGTYKLINQTTKSINKNKAKE